MNMSNQSLILNVLQYRVKKSKPYNCPDTNRPNCVFSFSEAFVLTNVQYLMFSGLKKDGYLVEASLSIEESNLQRGIVLTYWYGVKQRKKEIMANARRLVRIPLDPNIKGEPNKPFTSVCLDTLLQVFVFNRS